MAGKNKKAEYGVEKRRFVAVNTQKDKRNRQCRNVNTQLAKRRKAKYTADANGAIRKQARENALMRCRFAYPFSLLAFHCAKRVLVFGEAQPSRLVSRQAHASISKEPYQHYTYVIVCFTDEQQYLQDIRPRICVLFDRDIFGFDKFASNHSKTFRPCRRMNDNSWPVNMLDEAIRVMHFPN